MLKPLPPSLREQDHCLQPDVVEEVQMRLNRLAGHVHAVERMLAEGRNCANVLTQLVAVRAALTQVTMRPMEAHAHTCFTMIQGPEDQPQALEQLGAALAAALRDVWKI